MADYYAYGSAPANWQGWMGSTYTGTDTSGTWHFDVGIQAINGWHYQVNAVHWSLSFGGTVIGSGTGSFNVGTNGRVTLGSCSVTKYRTHARQDFPISFSVWISGTAFHGTSSWSGSDWLGGKASWAVSYDGNGGSTPGSQTKWYGEALTLAGAPSRAGYGFDGWSGSDGRTYAAGGSYTVNSSATMTAKWHRLYVPPACTLSVVRVSASSGTTEMVSGAYAMATAAWQVDTSVTSGNAAKSVKFEYRVRGASTWSAATTSGTQTGRSGTARAWFAASTGSSYEVRCTITDSVQGTSFTATVGTAVVPIDFGCKGRSVGLLTVASDTPDTISMRGTMVADGAKYPIGDSGWKMLYDGGAANGYIKYRRFDNLVVMEFSVLKEINGLWKAGTLPAGYRPDAMTHIAALTVGNDGVPLDHVTGATVDSSGNVTIGAAAHVAGQWAEGTACWFVRS